MIVVKDSMILIHLAKMHILTDSCQHFGEVIIPTKVYEETVINGKKKGHPDALIIEQTINCNLIKIKNTIDCVSVLETIGWFDTEVMHEMKRQIDRS